VEVTADDLTKPLGLEERRSRLPSIPVPVAPILAGLLVVALGGAAVYVALVDDPLAGQPHAIVPIEVAAAPQASVPAAEPTEGAASAADDARRRSASDVEDASGVSIMRPNGGAAPGSLIIRIPDAETGKLAAAPDRRLVERSRYRLLPKIGADSAKPWQVYARPGRQPPRRRAGFGAGRASRHGSRNQPDRDSGRHREAPRRRDARLRPVRPGARKAHGRGARGRA
jgi:hypothetical protein